MVCVLLCVCVKKITSTIAGSSCRSLKQELHCSSSTYEVTRISLNSKTVNPLPSPLEFRFLLLGLGGLRSSGLSGCFWAREPLVVSPKRTVTGTLKGAVKP